MATKQMWTLTVARVVYGSALLFARASPSRRRFDHAARVVARILGARLLVQAALAGPHSSPRRLRAGAAVDAIHGVTMVALAALKPARRAAASTNALAAFAFAAAGIFEARRNERLEEGAG